MIRRIWVSAVWVTLTAPTAAFAQNSQGERVGKNLGDMLGGWARSLFVGIAALIALKFLFERKFADLAVFLIAVVVVGGLVYAPGDIRTFVTGVWNSLTA
jgi:hypothetical protein